MRLNILKKQGERKFRENLRFLKKQKFTQQIADTVVELKKLIELDTAKGLYKVGLNRTTLQSYTYIHILSHFHAKELSKSEMKNYSAEMNRLRPIMNAYNSLLKKKEV